MTEEHKVKRTLRGIVVSTKPQKTAVVKVSRRIKHPLYGKFITRSSKIHAHLPAEMGCIEGNEVVIQECAPISKLKRWIVCQVVEKVS